MIRIPALLATLAAVAACEPGTTGARPELPEGPKFEIVEAARAADTTRVVLRYKDGTAIPMEDEGRAVIRAAQIACMDDESPIADTRSRAGGLLTVNIFCVSVTTSNEVIDGSGLLG